MSAACVHHDGAGALCQNWNKQAGSSTSSPPIQENKIHSGRVSNEDRLYPAELGPSGNGLIQANAPAWTAIPGAFAGGRGWVVISDKSIVQDDQREHVYLQTVSKSTLQSGGTAEENRNSEAFSSRAIPRRVNTAAAVKPEDDRQKSLAGQEQGGLQGGEGLTHVLDMQGTLDKTRCSSCSVVLCRAEPPLCETSCRIITRHVQEGNGNRYSRLLGFTCACKSNEIHSLSPTPGID